MRTKITLKADFDNGEGELGNLDKWRDAHYPLLRADILKDWMYLIEQEYARTIYEMRCEYADDELLATKAIIKEADKQKRDAERYRFLRKKINQGYDVAGAKQILKFKVMQKIFSNEDCEFSGFKLDCAIDIAKRDM